MQASPAQERRLTYASMIEISMGAPFAVEGCFGGRPPAQERRLTYASMIEISMVVSLRSNLLA